MYTIYDNGQLGDQHFRLEQDEVGLLYETSNAVTRALVCSQMFAGWDCDSDQWLKELHLQFGSLKVARRYQQAALDLDK